jgi:hypothetical protein
LISCKASEYAKGERNLDQHVNVIFHAADLVHEYLLVFTNTGQISPQTGLGFLGDELAPFFGAEYNMDGVVEIRMGHVPRLRRSIL